MTTARRDHRKQTRDYVIALMRAFGGAIIFSLPIFMTMEMWQLGVTVDRLSLCLLLVLHMPLLVGLSHVCGFEKTNGWLDDVVDAFAAWAVGCVAALGVLWVFGEIHGETCLDALLGKVALQAVPGSIGALLAQSEFGEKKVDRDNGVHHPSVFLIMLIGALFLALSVAPTEEIILLAQQMSPVQALVLLLASLAIMHAFVYAADFRGGAEVPEGTPRFSLFMRYTLPGYAVAMAVSYYLLWTFGRTEGLGAAPLVMSVITLAFPAAIGAASARLIL